MCKPSYSSLLLICGLFAASFCWGQNQDILRPHEAFKYTVANIGDAVQVNWTIEEGYYLYRKKTSFESETNSIGLGNIDLPAGEQHEDEFFGKQQVYRDRFLVTIPYVNRGTLPATFNLAIKSQGCADIGLCYPPQTWVETIELNSRGDNKIDLTAAVDIFSISNSEFVPVDEAFEPILTAIDSNRIEVAIRVKDGYYLYKEKIAAEAESDVAKAGMLRLPNGESKTDQYFGRMEVYYEDVFGELPIARATPEAMDLAIKLQYQGCADGGICYPPVTKVLTVSLPQASAGEALSAFSSSAPPISEQARLAKLITNSSLFIMTLTFFGAGLLLAFTPCVLPMVPILSTIIAGEGKKVSTARGFSLSLSYVLGMALIYTAAGIIAAAAGVQLQASFNQPWVLTLFAAFFVILAGGMFDFYDLQIPSTIQNRLTNISKTQNSGTLIGAFMMGAISSLIVTACVGPALIAALTVIAQTGDIARGGTALFAMSMGMGTPLLIVGIVQGKLLPKAGPWMVTTKHAFGFMMLGLAIWMVSRVLPGGITLALWGILVVMIGIYIGGLTKLSENSTGTQKFSKGAGLITIVYGSVLLVGSLAGSDSLLRPLEGLRYTSGNGNIPEHRGLKFQQVKTTADLDTALVNAAAEGKTTMLDFYADWCVSCIEMEEFTFTKDSVKDALSNTILLQADVTENDQADQALMARFNVFGPPTIIFFGADGLKRVGYEVVGYMKANEFARHVNRATNDTAYSKPTN